MTKLLHQEAVILETLMRNPHPNIVHNHGCLIKHRRIVDLVLERYTLDTWGTVENKHGRF
jgi:hypothetical protein